MTINLRQRDEQIESMIENIKGMVSKQIDEGFPKEKFKEIFGLEPEREEYLDEALKKLVKSKFLTITTVNSIQLYRYNPDQDTWGMVGSVKGN